MPTEQPAQTAVLRFLSGIRRGGLVELKGETLFVLRSGSGEIIITPPDGHPELHCIAILHRSGQTYEMVLGDEPHIWVNGHRTTEKHLLASGDLLELGPSGPLLRYRLFAEGTSPKKSLREALADSVDSARIDSHSGLGLTGRFLSRFTHDLAIETTAWFRIWTAAILSLVIIAIVALVIQNYRFQKQLFSESNRIESIARMLEQTEAGAMTYQDLGRLREDVELKLSEAISRLAALEARSDTAARIISNASPSVAFVQGSYGFIATDSAKELRYVRAPTGAYYFTFDETGKVVRIPFSGTAFVATASGQLVTNKHVVEPWATSENPIPPAPVELTPVVQRIRVFLPGEPNEFVIETGQSLEDADLALLQITDPPASLTALEIAAQPPVPGDEVLVMGYPFGISGILVRTNREFIDDSRSDEEMDLWQLGEKLAAEGYIKPLVSKGIVSQMTEQFIAYDAETTMGGSGGPVLNLHGKVVAVNTATMGRQGGSNLGVPATEISRLLSMLPAE